MDRRKRGRGRSGEGYPFATVVLLSVMLLMVPALVEADPGHQDDAFPDPFSRDIVACPGSEPPPEDDDGVGRGEWVIDCPAEEPVRITSSDIEVQGNISLIGETRLEMAAGAKITQSYSSGQRFYFRMGDGTSLSLTDGSELRTDTLTALPGSTVSIDDGWIHAGGQMNISSDSLTMTDGYLVNRALHGTGDVDGYRADLTISVEQSDISSSVIMSIGGNGGQGSQEVDGAWGGGSMASLDMGSTVLSDTIINISGGNGGHGADGLIEHGSSGGMGAPGRLEMSLSGSTATILDGLEISVTGGEGGSGGDGAMGQTSPGGNGGKGGVGGDAEMQLDSPSTISLIDTDVRVRGGHGGDGGTGGEAPDSVGGNGDDGGRGGNSVIGIESGDSLFIESSSLIATGGSGADGGFIGYGGEATGLAGDAGSGGDATVSLVTAGQVRTLYADLLSYGGGGGRGGLGSLVAGDGGDGGDAVLDIDSSGPMTLEGSVAYRSEIGAVAGDGGPGGDAIMGTGQGQGMRGRGGDGGGSECVLRSEVSIMMATIDLRAARSSGGMGEKAGSPGRPGIRVDTPEMETFNGTMEWTLEVITDGPCRADLYNTTVKAPVTAEVDPEKDGVVVNVWWYLDVLVSGSSPSESWTIEVYRGPEVDGDPNITDVIVGPSDTASFTLLGERIDAAGVGAMNYTIIGVLEGPDPVIYTEPRSVFLTRSIEVHLSPSYTPWPPVAEVSYPLDKDVFSTGNLEPCGREDDTVPAPGCLRIEGSAWVSDQVPKARIRDVMVVLTHEHQGSYTFRNISEPGVVLDKEGVRRTNWRLDWEVGAHKDGGHQFRWPEGRWVITARAYDGITWSGSSEPVIIEIVHTASDKPPYVTDAGPPQAFFFDNDEEGKEVTFSGALVRMSEYSGNISIIRMEWDYDGDGIIDWSHVPSSCDPGQSCQAPNTTHFFSEEGYYNARFCVLDDMGRKSCDVKKVGISQNPPPAVGVSQGTLLLTSLLVICVCSVITTSLIIASLSEAVKYSILSFILLPLYTRLKKEELLDNYTRGEIRGYIVANPGAHYSRIKRDLDLNNGTLIYHLKALEREGFIYSHRDDYYRRFYPRGRKPRPGPNLTTVQEAIIEHLLEDPEQTAEDLAGKLEKSRKVVNYHLVWLRRWGLVEARKEGRSKIYSVIYEDEVEMEEDAAARVMGKRRGGTSKGKGS